MSVSAHGHLIECLRFRRLVQEWLLGRDFKVFAHYMSLVMRKPDFRICENEDADQLRGNREADQRLCFRYTDSHLLWLYSPVCVGPGRKTRRPVFSQRGSYIYH